MLHELLLLLLSTATQCHLIHTKPPSPSFIVSSSLLPRMISRSSPPADYPISMAHLAGAVEGGSRSVDHLRRHRHLRREYAALAVGGQQRGGEVAVLAAHDRHRYPPLHRILEVGLVSLPQHALHPLRQPKELELHVQVGEAVVGGNVVLVDPVVLFRHGDDRRPDLERPGEDHDHAVDGGGALHEEVACGRRGPGGEVADAEVEGLAVEGEGEVVGAAVPGGSGGGGDGDGVLAEEDAKGLDPRVVVSAAGGAEADEAGIDLEAGVGDEREVLVRLAAEVEHDAIAADEPRVLAP